MPIDPPSISAPESFQPAFLTDDDLVDLETFTGLSRKECLERVRSYSLGDLAKAWALADPRTPDELVAFYRATDLYIWELMQWHASTARQPYWQALSYVAENFPAARGWRRVYDFGCGVGTDALFLATRGYDVTLVDVDSPTLRFAKHRFERRGIKARFIESISPLPEPMDEYDMIICFDVFEHLPDPLTAAQRLAGALRKDGLFVQQGAFSDEGYHPCHLGAGIARYGGLRWHIQLVGLGMRNIAGFVYRKNSGWRKAVQKTRYFLWRATGFWLTWVGK
jgi:SAM-dependent methyltransferase